MKDKPLKSQEELHVRLAQFRGGVGGLRIGIDGMDGVGKSTLARELANRLGGSVISLDDYLTKRQNSYVLHIRCDDVKAAISASKLPTLIEGVCLLAVAQRCGFEVDALVYVRRISGNSGIWHEEEICMALSPPDELKQKERALREAFSTTEKSGNLGDDDLGLTGELIDYHARWRPVERALVFDIGL
ncbi:hypothetical protein JQ617_03395 [Bradyrhizobium sp. KB893862 SZCCT0404]|uniref:hypothetical protein n=1 Tax=Bradyrhizobium sp. KB893862 SZCCT0404 TaxID=2807672 RepID=UPI001BA45F95|nr:hypothetical protein [Bradyrhizobium sp. KB893862 SZCCT0404]MBR1172990.1 hypothetical protein [Bradyrhizobium sp. KB893862 SZCCT0404]